MRRRLAAALVGAAALLLLAGFGATPAQRVAWLKPWSAWTTGLENDLDAAATFPKKTAGASALFTRLAGCENAARRVPAAPRDFAAIERLDADVCAKAMRAARDGRAALAGDGAVADRYPDSLGEASDAYSELLDVAWKALFFNRPIPTQRRVTGASRIEPTLSRVAARVYELTQPVEVRCWSKRDWPQAVAESDAWYGDKDTPDLLDGFAEPDDRRIHLPQADCGPLTVYLYGDPTSIGRYTLAYTVGTLVHEAAHIAHPDASEAVTECHGLQHVAAGARALGVPAADAASLARLYWKTIYPDEPDEYITPRCRAGGPLDETPNDGVWP